MMSLNSSQNAEGFHGKSKRKDKKFNKEARISSNGDLTNESLKGGKDDYRHDLPDLHYYADTFLHFNKSHVDETNLVIDFGSQEKAQQMEVFIKYYNHPRRFTYVPGDSYNKSFLMESFGSVEILRTKKGLCTLIFESEADVDAAMEKSVKLDSLSSPLHLFVTAGHDLRRFKMGISEQNIQKKQDGLLANKGLKKTDKRRKKSSKKME